MTGLTIGIEGGIGGQESEGIRFAPFVFHQMEVDSVGRAEGTAPVFQIVVHGTGKISQIPGKRLIQLVPGMLEPAGVDPGAAGDKGNRVQQAVPLFRGKGNPGFCPGYLQERIPAQGLDKSGGQAVQELEGGTGILRQGPEAQLIQGRPGLFQEVLPEPGLFRGKAFFRGIRLETTGGKEKIQGMCAGFHG